MYSIYDIAFLTKALQLTNLTALHKLNCFTLNKPHIDFII